MKNELIIITPEEIEQSRTASRALADGYNHLHAAISNTAVTEAVLHSMLRAVVPDYEDYLDIINDRAGEKSEAFQKALKFIRHVSTEIRNGQRAIAYLLMKLNPGLDPVQASTAIQYGEQRQEDPDYDAFVQSFLKEEPPTSELVQTPAKELVFELEDGRVLTQWHEAALAVPYTKIGLVLELLRSDTGYFVILGKDGKGGHTFLHEPDVKRIFHGTKVLYEGGKVCDGNNTEE